MRWRILRSLAYPPWVLAWVNSLSVILTVRRFARLRLASRIRWSLVRRFSLRRPWCMRCLTPVGFCRRLRLRPLRIPRFRRNSILPSISTNFRRRKLIRRVMVVVRRVDRFARPEEPATKACVLAKKSRCNRKTTCCDGTAWATRSVELCYK